MTWIHFIYWPSFFQLRSTISMHWMLSTWLLLNTRKALGKSYCMMWYIQSGMICSLPLFSVIYKEPVKSGVLLVRHSPSGCTVKPKHVRLRVLFWFSIFMVFLFLKLILVLVCFSRFVFLYCADGVFSHISSCTFFISHLTCGEMCETAMMMSVCITNNFIFGKLSG